MVTGAGGASTSLLDRWLRPGANTPRDVIVDLLWLSGLALLLMATGLGLRDPWPADEPRFALVAQDMLRSGDWMIPRVGGDLYADKPPVFFWLMAAAMALTGSLRIGFLLPSLLAGIGSVMLVYDLLRRVRGREVAFAGSLVLLLTFQFVWQFRQAQIDGVLCFLTTLSLYGLLRHLFAGPGIGWFYVGWFAAGIGVVTKGVGFLPLLLLIPFAVLAARGWPATVPHRDSRWWLGPVFFLGAIALWFVPMMLVTSAGGELLAYRNEILFRQTVTRYAGAWHHHEPFWFYLVNVIPVLWLPLTALVPWLWPRWRAALRPGSRDTFVAVLLAWVALVVLFFSLSSGKRGVYVLPAIPALVMASATWLPEILRSPKTRTLAFTLAAILVAGTTLGAVYFAIDGQASARLVRDYGVAPLLPLTMAGVGGLVALALFRVRDGWLAYGGALAAILATVGLLVYPRMDDARSGRAFMAEVEQAAAGIAELGLVDAKEQYLLQLRRPSVNFGHARWQEKAAEAADAAAWYAAKPGRALLVHQKTLETCFEGMQAQELGRANRQHWFLVTGGNADPACVAAGDLRRARLYIPPNASINSAP
ncbi:MAG: glycosyltransferase family 39 protein [Steroidobacteraceae bacterium]|nr:glycosyltransferase family 39 protein [Steroidobacteraceae bacterium]MBP7013995.1 glycosyltransferase family 39 protein [Steroidobacteraceae bacterium]